MTEAAATTRVCPKCGGTIATTAIFCRHCKTHLQEAAAIKRMDERGLLEATYYQLDAIAGYLKFLVSVTKWAIVLWLIGLALQVLGLV